LVCFDHKLYLQARCAVKVFDGVPLKKPCGELFGEKVEADLKSSGGLVIVGRGMGTGTHPGVEGEGGGRGSLARK
jgi:hypothetical protein